MRQECSLSPTLFNIYVDDLIITWKKASNPGIQINKNNHVSTLMYADDIILIQSTEDDLQRVVHQLSQMSRHYNLKISPNKTKVMAHRGKDSYRK